MQRPSAGLHGWVLLTPTSHGKASTQYDDWDFGTCSIGLEAVSSWWTVSHQSPSFTTANPTASAKQSRNTRLFCTPCHQWYESCCFPKNHPHLGNAWTQVQHLDSWVCFRQLSHLFKQYQGSDSHFHSSCTSQPPVLHTAVCRAMHVELLSGKPSVLW